ncbi:hypothetical protein L0244_17105 [bacterium]|nr:hypothetical protein [bacterium]
MAEYLHTFFRMKKAAILLVTYLFFAGYSRADVPFRIITEAFPDHNLDDYLSISISLQDETLFSLGYTTKPLVGEHGVDPKTIRVEILHGSENLLHISWSTYLEGMGGYMTDFSIIALQKNPSKIILKRQFFISGHGGFDNWGSGRHSITYNDSVLKVFYQHLNGTLTHTPKIGSLPFEGSSGTFYVTIQEFILIEKYRIFEGGSELEETIQKYKILNGDNVKRICKIMEWEPEWVQNPKPLIAGRWLTAKIPYGVAVLRWPAIAKFED